MVAVLVYSDGHVTDLQSIVRSSLIDSGIDTVVCGTADDLVKAWDQFDTATETTAINVDSLTVALKDMEKEANEKRDKMLKGKRKGPDFHNRKGRSKRW
jgi:uncharacterized protein (DUF927 family)